MKIINAEEADSDYSITTKSINRDIGGKRRLLNEEMNTKKNFKNMAILILNPQNIRSSKHPTIYYEKKSIFVGKVNIQDFKKSGFLITLFKALWGLTLLSTFVLLFTPNFSIFGGLLGSNLLLVIYYTIVDQKLPNTLKQVLNSLLTTTQTSTPSTFIRGEHNSICRNSALTLSTGFQCQILEAQFLPLLLLGLAIVLNIMSPIMQDMLSYLPNTARRLLATPFKPMFYVPACLFLSPLLLIQSGINMAELGLPSGFWDLLNFLVSFCTFWYLVFTNF